MYYELVTTQNGEHLRAFLAERDAQCPGCAYNLRGATTDICPECGTQLSIDAIEEAMRARVAFVSPLARLIAGGVLLVFTLICGSMVATGVSTVVRLAVLRPRFSQLGALAGCAFVVAFVVMLWWVYIQRWRGRQAKRAKAILAKMAICMVPALVLWFMMFIAMGGI